MMHPTGSMKRLPGHSSHCKQKDSGVINRMRYSSAPSTSSKPGVWTGKSSVSIARYRSRAMLRKRIWLMRKSASPPSAMPSDPPMESFSPQGGRVHPDLEALLLLQDKDVAVTSCDARLKALDPEVRNLDDQIAAAERFVEQARAGIRSAVDRRDGLEGKIQNYRTMQDQRRQKLEWVRGAKEASTLMAELDLARSVLAKEEAEFMRSGDAVTEAERKAAEAERALEEERARQAPLRETLAGKREQIATERERASAERERATAAVGASLLALYERIRRGK